MKLTETVKSPFHGAFVPSGEGGGCNLIYISFKKEGGGKSRWEDRGDGFMSVFSPFSYFCFFTLDRDGFR